MKRFLVVSLILPFAYGCTSKSAEDADTGNDQSVDQPEDVVPEAVDAEPLFEVTGALLDLAIAPDGRIFASIEEHAIDVWDPATEWVEQHTDRAGPIFGISWSEDTIWYTTSSHRQAGALMKLDGKNGVVIAEAQGDTIFREPRDLCRTSDDKWVITDTTLGLLFIINDDGSSVERLSVPLTDLSTVACDTGHVYVGGDDGVVRIPWPDGSPETIDSRPVDGLHIAKGIAWGTNRDWGVFEVGGDRRLELPDIGRPGRMAGQDSLLVTDSAAGAVWLVSLSGID